MSYDPYACHHVVYPSKKFTCPSYGTGTRHQPSSPFTSGVIHDCHCQDRSTSSAFDKHRRCMSMCILVLLRSDHTPPCSIRSRYHIHPRPDSVNARTRGVYAVCHPRRHEHKHASHHTHAVDHGPTDRRASSKSIETLDHVGDHDRIWI